MQTTDFDHIAIASPTLESGVKWVSEVLGVTPEKGGEHLRIGTHNRLLRLGDTIYLEVIAPNPDAPRPSRPRWFGLDNLVPGSLPALTTWVLRTNDIRATVDNASEPLGEIEPMSRGEMNWQITIPADGSIPLNGCAPALIEWQTAVHPAAMLEDQGLSLERLDIYHPDPERIERLFTSLGFQGAVSLFRSSPGDSAHLAAHIRTPQGVKTLGAA